MDQFMLNSMVDACTTRIGKVAMSLSGKHWLCVRVRMTCHSVAQPVLHNKNTC